MVSQRTERPGDERGATAVEYGLLVALIAGVIIGTLILLSDPVSGLYGRVRW